MIDAGAVESADHHSDYLAKAVADLTADGRERVAELLRELAESFADRPSLVGFASARAAEFATGRVGAAQDAGPERELTGEELEELKAGFTVIRDQEPRDDVADWANAILALLSDEAHRRSS